VFAFYFTQSSAAEGMNIIKQSSLKGYLNLAQGKRSDTLGS
jgi:hypothetical protein